jgi:hypothetical protein
VLVTWFPDKPTPTWSGHLLTGMEAWTPVTLNLELEREARTADPPVSG